MQPESETLEYKKATNALPKEFWPTYSSFANTKGGKIVLGVTESKQNSSSIEKLEITGVNESSIDKIIKEIITISRNTEKISIGLITDENIQVITHEGKKMIEVTIPEAPIHKKPVHLYKEFKHSYIRKNDGDYKLTADELKRMIRDSSSDSDSEFLYNYSLEDLYLPTIQKYKKILYQNSNDERYLNISDDDLLIESGAKKIDRDGDRNYHLTVGGLLFFGTESAILSKYPHFQLDFFNKTQPNIRWVDRVSSGYDSSDNLNVFEFFLTVLEKLKLTVLDSFELNESSTRKNTKNDVEISLREYLANSLIHADYAEKLPIKIDAYLNFYEFFNPGKMVISVNEFAKGGLSQPRNPILAQLFRKAKFCERAGSGGLEIFQIAVKNQYKLPDVTSENDRTTIKLWKIDLSDAHPDLNDNERKIMKYLGKKFSPKSFAAIQNDISLSRHHTTTALKSLQEKNLIVITGKGRSTRYSVTKTNTAHLAELQHLVHDYTNHMLR